MDPLLFILKYTDFDPSLYWQGPQKTTDKNGKPVPTLVTCTCTNLSYLLPDSYNPSPHASSLLPGVLGDSSFLYPQPYASSHQPL